MQIKNKNNSLIKKRVILLIIGSAALIVGVLAVLEKMNVINLFSSLPSSYTEERRSPEDAKKQNETDASNKKDFVESDTKTSDNPQEGTAPQVPTSPDTIELAYEQPDSATVTVTTKLHGYADGTCLLTVANGQATKSFPADILYQPEYSICTGFSVPVSSVGKGTWTFSLSVTPQGGTAITKSISGEVR